MPLDTHSLIHSPLLSFLLFFTMKKFSRSIHEWMMDTLSQMLLPNTLTQEDKTDPIFHHQKYFQNEMETKIHRYVASVYRNQTNLCIRLFLLYSCTGPTPLPSYYSLLLLPFYLCCLLHRFLSTISVTKYREWNMVGLSVVLEVQRGCINKKTPQVLNKTTILSSTIHKKPPLPPSLFQPPTFLDQCFLCGKKLLAGKDIYMYKWVLLIKINKK